MKPRRRALVRALVVVCALPALGCGARASSSSAATSPPSVTAASPAPTGGPLTLTSRRIAVLAEGALVIDNGSVPRCAMQVWRDEDLGPLYSLQPDEPCGCYYEAHATGATGCGACQTDAECPGDAPRCRHGYCEAS